MTVLTKADPARQRSTLAWSLILAVVTLSLAGVIGWSCFRPVVIRLNNHEIGLGYGSDAVNYYIEHYAVDSPSGTVEPDIHPPPLLSVYGDYYFWWF